MRQFRNDPFIIFLSLVLALILLLAIAFPVLAVSSVGMAQVSSSSFTLRMDADRASGIIHTVSAVKTQVSKGNLNSLPESSQQDVIPGLLADSGYFAQAHAINAASTPSAAYSSPDTSDLQQTDIVFFPLVFNELPPPPPAPPETILYCDSLGNPEEIPDDNPDGIDDQIYISDQRKIVSLNLYLDISHTWVGDLVVSLTNQDTGVSLTAIDRPGIPHSDLGCGIGNIITNLADKANQPAEDQCAGYAPAISGIFQPQESLSTFSRTSISGNWNLNVSDNYPNDTGRLNHWCLEATIADPLPTPNPLPTPAELPESAYVPGMSGQDQQFTLDCESRSAVDWARHFGFNIDELDFLAHLPQSDDPEAGFVGDPDGPWGKMPPDDYGVHAPPVAKLLREYGLEATAHRSLQWDELRAQIASGNPVIVWVIGGVSRNLVNGIPYYYTASSTGNTTIVAPGEHTVILVGYTPDSVTVLNGESFVDVPLDQFLDSWSVLDFMAVLAGQ